MQTKKIAVYTENDNRNFFGWTIEKVSKALSSLCRMVSNDGNIKNDTDFQLALSYTLSVYAYFHGDLTKISCEITEKLLFNYGYEGYLYLEDLIHETSNSLLLKNKRAIENEKEIAHNIIRLINENKPSNRTLIANELSKVNSTKNQWFIQIDNDIEYVHQGEKTWEWFYLKHYNDMYIQEKPTDSFLQEVYDYFKS